MLRFEHSRHSLEHAKKSAPFELRGLDTTKKLQYVHVWIFILVCAAQNTRARDTRNTGQVLSCALSSLVLVFCAGCFLVEHESPKLALYLGFCDICVFICRTEPPLQRNNLSLLSWLYAQRVPSKHCKKHALPVYHCTFTRTGKCQASCVPVKCNLLYQQKTFSFKLEPEKFLVGCTNGYFRVFCKLRPVCLMYPNQSNAVSIIARMS